MLLYDDVDFGAMIIFIMLAVVLVITMVYIHSFSELHFDFRVVMLFFGIFLMYFNYIGLLDSVFLAIGVLTIAILFFMLHMNKVQEWVE